MSPDDVVAWYSLLAKGGWGVLAVVILYGGYRQWWVYGWMYRQMKTDRDLLMDGQERTLSVADRALRLLDGGER
jgi:hypothetical protein